MILFFKMPKVEEKEMEMMDGGERREKMLIRDLFKTCARPVNLKRQKP